MPYSTYFAEEIMRPTIIKNHRNQRNELALLNKAYAKMLVRCGLLDEKDRVTIAGGLDRALAALGEDTLDGNMTDLYFSMESALYAQIGEETACRLHLGRSRNDIYCALARMEIRKSIWQLAEHLVSLQHTILDTATKNLRTIIPYYTYGQPAQPGTYAHYLVTLAAMLGRDLDRLQAAYRNTNRSPMGGAASIGTSFGIDKTYMAELLGFDGVIDNSLDAVASFDFLLETEAAVAILMNTASKTASDLFFWATDECRILDCDLSISGGSSIMPQKKNPAGVENVRAKSSHAAGLLAGGLMATKNTSLFPVSDNFETTFLYWEHLDQAAKTLGMLEDALKHSAIRKDIAFRRALDSFTGATALAEALTLRFGIPFVETHHVVGEMVRQLMAKDRLHAAEMTEKLLRAAARTVLGKEIIFSDAEIAEALSPAHGLDAKVTGGTPKVRDTKKLISAGKKHLAGHERRLAAAKQQVWAAYAKIDA